VPAVDCNAKCRAMKKLARPISQAQQRRRKRRIDILELAVLVALIVVAFAVSIEFDLNENWLAFSAIHEAWELDEMPVALATCSLLVLGFAVRRWFDAATQARRAAALNDRLVLEVTGHRQAAVAVREREAQLAKLIDSMDDGLALFDAFGEATHVNNRFCEIAGYACNDVLNRHFADLAIFADCDTGMNEAVIGLGGRVRCEQQLRRGDGMPLDAVVTATPLRDEMGQPFGGFVLLSDVTELRRAERLRQLSEARLNAFFTEAPAGLAMWDSSLKILQVNETLAGSGGLGIEHFAGRRLREIVPDLGREIEPLLERVIGSGLPATNARVTVTDSRAPSVKQHWLVSAFPLPNAAGGIGGAGAILVDVSEWQEAEHRLRQAQKMEALGKLTGGVAHDFDNLLAVIIGNLDLMLDGADEPEDAGNLARIAHAAALRGADLTQRLLTYARSQDLRPRPIDVPDMLADMRGMLSRTLGETVELTIDVADDIWPCHADRNQLDNAILNLAVNAREAFDGAGSLIIRAQNATSRPGTGAGKGIADLPPGEYVRFAVIDDGPGMSADVRRRAFEPFFTTSADGRGTGLGLSTVYGFARQSGGVAQIISAEGRGTTVEIFLPRADSAPAGAAARPAPDAAKAMAHVLLVEDDPDVRQTLAGMLSRMGCRTTCAEDGPAALELVGGDASFDILVTDIGLPGGLDGRALAESVAERCPNLPTLFVSGYSFDGATGSNNLPDCAAMLQKPFSRIDLQRSLEGLLKAQAA